jgi:exopolysaccharide biosynthesis polyprenyl glycosylphosphotransferase
LIALLVRDLWFSEWFAITREFTLSDQFVGFNALHAVWLFVFYSVGLYDLERVAVSKGLCKQIGQAIVICGLLGLGLFYALNSFGLNSLLFKMPPRFALGLDLSFIGVLLYTSRVLFVRWSCRNPNIRVMVCGNGAEVSQFKEFVDRHPHLGVNVCEWMVVDGRYGLKFEEFQIRIQQSLAEDRTDIIAVTRVLNDHEQIRDFLYKLLCSGVHIVDFTHLYEEVTGKIPSSLINEGWFVGSVRAFNRGGFELAKRLLDVAMAIILAIPTLLCLPLVAAAIKLESPGSVLFCQRRVGRDGRVFSVLKFRTMVTDAERNGAQWAIPEDPRVTRVGRLLRKTRIDELPQLWNVLIGEMSLVGPRPERPEFVQELSKRIRFFGARSMVRPGLTGWAQINFGYGSTESDALEKLQYDLYYIKNRSITLDLIILLKTASTILRYEGR